MKLAAAVEVLARMDRQQGRHVYALRELEKLFPESPRARQATIGRLVQQGVLKRAARGVYVYALSAFLGRYTLEWIAVTLRRGEYCYLSLESALSAYGVISQIPMRYTIMTTGRRGEHVTPFGTIEFTHTERPLGEVMDSYPPIEPPGEPFRFDEHNPLPMATCQAALRDLRRVGRNTHLIDEDAAIECCQ